MAGIFKRVEKKYLLNDSQRKAFMERLEGRTEEDVYGKYSISNIYFDTADNELIRESLNKPVYKEKLRLRSYGTPKDGDKVFLEMKKKWKGVVYKRRVEFPYRVAMDYIEKGIYPKEYDCQILKEIDYMIKYHGLRPDTFLAYDRRAYVVSEDKNIRFTIDERIRSRKYDLRLSDGDKGKLLMDDDMSLLEIKAPGALPTWFVQIMSELGIFSTSFSKFGRVYQEGLEETNSYERSESLCLHHICLIPQET
ncbi:MAG: polyphosphate polymerase domain-containing protein [Lachnospiraceae bacterium]|nr:polyphosphate polymerase domain-containing protein [Lachnospiraceae bacterium]